MKYKIKLIAPSANRFYERGSSKFHISPLALAVLASRVPEEFEVTIVDEASEEFTLSDNDDADIVGISAFTANVKRGYEIAEFYRNRNVAVFMGGHHVSALPEEALKYCDAVIIGEGDIILQKVLDDFKEGKMKGIYKAEERYDLTEMPFSRLDLLPEKVNYLFKPTIHLTRGCPHSCDFCCVPPFYGRKLRKRPADEIIAELKHIKENYTQESNWVHFNDDNFFVDKEYAKDVLRKMIPLDLKFQAFAGLDIAEDDELLDLAKQAGALGFYVGFDALHSEDLEGATKSVNTKYNYIKWVKKIQEDHGIPVIAGVVVGFDHETKDSFEKLYEFLVESHVASMSMNILYPYPGTKLFDRMKEQNRITSYDWDNYVMDGVNYIPARMTQDELHDGYVEIARRFSADEAIEERARYAATTKMGELGAETIRQWGKGIKRHYQELLMGDREQKIKRPKVSVDAI